jgi:signal-transduction protein with cAMP-binding, CBS, and nucleotidyltransferase domain
MECLQASLTTWLIMTDYLRKIIVQGRSSKTTKVGDIMTEEVYFASCDFFRVDWINNLMAQM